MAAYKHTKTPIDAQALIARMKKRADEMRDRADQTLATTPQQLFLPGMDDVMRAMPNHIARSSLFAPVARGRKKVHQGTTLHSRGDVEITFWGTQLDETQADVWMQCLKEAQRQPLGTPVVINRAQLLRSLGRATSGQNYKWLFHCMKELAFAMLVIEVKSKNGKTKYSIGHARSLHLIEGFDYDEDREEYTLTVDPRWHRMYQNREFALIDWGKRFEFGRGQDMAKALQRLLASSSNTIQRYNLEWLKDKMEYRGRLRDFRSSLTHACVELKRLAIIDAHRIENNTRGEPQLVLHRPAASM